MLGGDLEEGRLCPPFFVARDLALEQAKLDLAAVVGRDADLGLNRAVVDGRDLDVVDVPRVVAQVASPRVVKGREAAAVLAELVERVPVSRAARKGAAPAAPRLVAARVGRRRAVRAARGFDERSVGGGGPDDRGHRGGGGSGDSDGEADEEGSVGLHSARIEFWVEMEAR